MPGPANLRASATVAATALAIAGCGGGESRGAGAGAGDAGHTVDVERVAFPARQRIGQSSTFAMTVRNSGETTIRDLVVTLRGFSRRGEQTPQRPLWLVDAPPDGSATALDDTYAAGPLAPGRRATLRWRVTAVVAGAHELRYAVAGARLRDGGRPTGSVRARIDAKPPFARVDPRTGRVIREDGSPPNG